MPLGLSDEALRLSESIRDEPAVFLVGEARSGTSILGRALVGQEDFRVNAAETGEELTETKLFLYPDHAFEPGDGKGVDVLNYMMGDQQAFEKMQSLVAPLAPGPMKVTLKRKAGSAMRRLGLGTIPRWRLAGNDHLLRIYFALAKSCRQQQRLFEKSPQHILNLPEIDVTFPKSKWVYIYRHPLDTFGSYRKRYQRNKDAGKPEAEIAWMDISAELIAERLAKHFQLAIDAQAAQPDRMMLVNYDTFTESPEPEMARVMQHIGAEFDPGRLPGARDSQWDPGSKLFKPIAPSPSTAMQFITPEEAKLVEERLSPLMKQLGIGGLR